MTIARDDSLIELVHLDQINVVNPRKRNRREFGEIVRNISEIGLKRPITVTRREGPDGWRYDLICGQGRLEAYQALGQKEIPALVVNTDNHEALIMSLVENIARRKRRPIEMLQNISTMKTRGDDEKSIARKVGLTIEYVRGILRLLEAREDRLLRAVEWGHIPISVAVRIAGSDRDDMRTALSEAYESGSLKGKQLIAARRLVEQRLRSGKGISRIEGAQAATVSSAELIRGYQDEVDRKRLLIRTAEAVHERLTFIIEAVRKLLADQNFVALLRAEGLESLPSSLADRLRS